MIPNTDRKGKAWAVVCTLRGEPVKKVETRAYRIDRTVAGMLHNMSPDYYVDEWYEFPEKGEKDANGKVRK